MYKSEKNIKNNKVVYLPPTQHILYMVSITKTWDEGHQFDMQVPVLHGPEVLW